MIPLSWYMTLAAILFCIGVCGFLTRRNVIIMFLSIELMLNGVNLNLVALSHFMDSLRGQAFTFFIITVAAAEAAIGLGIAICPLPEQAFRACRLHQPTERITAMPASLLAIPLLPLASFVLTLLLGKRWGTRAHWLPIVTVLLSFACALAAFFRVRSGEIINQDIYTWIQSGNLSVSVGFLVDH